MCRLDFLNKMLERKIDRQRKAIQTNQMIPKINKIFNWMMATAKFHLGPVTTDTHKMFIGNGSNVFERWHENSMEWNGMN